MNKTLYIITNKLKNTTKKEVFLFLGLFTLYYMCQLSIIIYFDLKPENVFTYKIAFFIFIFFCVALFSYFYYKKELLDFYYNKERPHIYYIIMERITLPITINFLFFILISLCLGIMNTFTLDFLLVDLLSGYYVLTEPSGSGDFWSIIGSPGNPGEGSGSGGGSGPSGGSGPGGGSDAGPIIPLDTVDPDEGLRRTIFNKLTTQYEINKSIRKYQRPSIFSDYDNNPKAKISPIEKNFVLSYIDKHPESGFSKRTFYEGKPNEYVDLIRGPNRSGADRIYACAPIIEVFK